MQSPLPYALNALTPVISETQLDLHYNKHHKAYVTNLNVLTKKMTVASKAGDFERYVSYLDDYTFNAGGNVNHEFFWQSLTPESKLPEKGSVLRPLIE